MKHKITIKKRNAEVILALAILMTLFTLPHVFAAPSGPTVTFIKNETASPTPAALINTSGGTISTIVLNATTQNVRWKAYVGNVSGTLVLDDGSDNSIFDWTVTYLTGEVYATRYSGSINWTGINCSNTTHIELENKALNHTNRDDNITTTFGETTHQGFFAGTSEILQNSCFSLHTYVNDSSQSSVFEEVVLYDGTTSTNGNVVYATPLENDEYGFDNNTYDFQMIVPENGLPGFTSSTGYYFYVELT